MTTREFIAEFAYPLRSPGILVALVCFYLLLQLAGAAGLLGLWLLIAVVPALFRYLVLLAEARASSRDPDPPGIEYFSLAGNLWSLFPAIPACLFVLGLYFGASAGWPWFLLCAVAAAAALPAMMAVLVVTHSPLEALDPRGWYRLAAAVGRPYLYAVALVVAMISALLWLGYLPEAVQSILLLYLLFAFYAVVGAMLREPALAEAAELPESPRADPAVSGAALERRRRAVLAHAWAFVSRGNRTGGLRHVYEWLERDPEPAMAWRWFFERMLDWDDTDPALLFAQVWLSRLLLQNDRVGAAKLMLRGRMVNERFRPKEEDLQAAIAAAESTGNSALADALRRL